MCVCVCVRVSVCVGEVRVGVLGGLCERACVCMHACVLVCVRLFWYECVRACVHASVCRD